MKISTLISLATTLTLVACGSSESPEPNTEDNGASQNTAAAAPGADLAAGAEYFKITCTPCHGPTGHGDGPASAALDPKPRNLSDKSWQDSVDDDYLRKIIQYGGAAVGKSAAMPANPVLGGQPATLDGLVAHIRSLAN